MKKYCLVLEGGGAKCAYQNGALEVLERAGFKFNAVSGTSFGALNAAMYLEGKNERLTKFWDNLNPGEMFGDEKLNDIFTDLYHKKVSIEKENLKFLIDGLKNVSQVHDQISTGYFNTIASNVNEKAIRQSNNDLVIVTCKLPSTKDILFKGIKKLFTPAESFAEFFKPDYEKFFFNSLDMEPLVLAKEDIEEGKLPSFVCASASIPPFKQMEIDGVRYYDGGAYDNCPVDCMIKRGYKDFVVIRTNPGMIEEVEDHNYLIIAPKNSLGSCAMFARENIKDLKKQGCLDALAIIDEVKKHNIIWKIRRKKIVKSLENA